MRIILTELLKTTPYLFFTGKGGVGKTSLACATAIELADGGNKVLLVSTDPASSPKARCNFHDLLTEQLELAIKLIGLIRKQY